MGRVKESEELQRQAVDDALCVANHKAEILEKAIDEAIAWLRNDLYKTRVKNTLNILEEALDEVREL